MTMTTFVNVCVTYMQLYVQSRVTWSFSKLFRHLVQAVAVYIAVFVGLSRISDYKHHWSDVLAGAVLGTLVACLSVSSITDIVDFFTTCVAGNFTNIHKLPVVLISSQKFCTIVMQQMLCLVMLLMLTHSAAHLLSCSQTMHTRLGASKPQYNVLHILKRTHRSLYLTLNYPLWDPTQLKTTYACWGIKCRALQVARKFCPENTVASDLDPERLRWAIYWLLWILCFIFVFFFKF